MKRLVNETDGQTNKQAERERSKHTNRKIDKQTNKHKQTDKLKKKLN